jgi:hypothetical protein
MIRAWTRRTFGGHTMIFGVAFEMRLVVDVLLLGSRLYPVVTINTQFPA